MESVVTKAGLQSFYAGKKVFITGHTGFKGTWLMAFLHQLGAVIKGYALAPEDSKPFHDLFISQNLATSIIADIRDRQRLANEVLSFEPDVIFHLAAQPLVIRSYQVPAETFEINAAGTANLLEAVLHLKKKCTVVVITTDKVYENKEQDILYSEEDQLGGYDPYSASKACAELVVSSFRNSFFNPAHFPAHQKTIASARAGNVIGGGDWSRNRIIPDTVTALMNNQPVQVRNPSAVRPWQHVLEPLNGYLILAAQLHEHPGKYAPAYNFGPLPQDHLTVKELVEIAIKTWGAGSMANGSQQEAPHEASILKLNIQKALTELHWLPKLTATDAIKWTIDWYKAGHEKQAAITFEQVENYLSR